MTLDKDRLLAFLNSSIDSFNERATQLLKDDEGDLTAPRYEGAAHILRVVSTKIINGEFDAEDWPPLPRKVPMEDIISPVRSKVRAHARGTSWDAAYAQAPEGTQKLYRVIYALLLRVGPMTDHEMRAEMTKRDFKHSYSGVSARRVELERAGWVRSSGQTRTTENASRAIVWEAVPEEIS